MTKRALWLPVKSAAEEQAGPASPASPAELPQTLWQRLRDGRLKLRAGTKDVTRKALGTEVALAGKG